MYRSAERSAPLLVAAHRSSLALAIEHDLAEIAFPAISCGVYGYPLDEACAIAVREVKAFLAEHDEMEKVYFVAFGDDVKKAYQRAME